MKAPVSVREWALRALVVGVLCIALAYLSAFLPAPYSLAGPWLMAIMMPITMFAMMILGAVRDVRGLGPLTLPFLLVLLLVVGGFLLALALPAETVDTPLLLGLPRRAAVVLFGVGLLPLFVLPVVYALTFDKLTLTDDDIARVRAARLPETRSIGAREGMH